MHANEEKTGSPDSTRKKESREVFREWSEGGKTGEARNGESKERK